MERVAHVCEVWNFDLLDKHIDRDQGNHGLRHPYGTLYK